ncbi:hypothetical protein FACS189462_5300 [Spirochaetia bacterium]|nr:hypothetical protein FACS189462_5300 [Spirochaetia bacterium]
MNDISFVIADTLIVLIEHQSTINENMPIRLLFYITEIYKKLTGDEDIYRERKIPLPRPEFIVLYTGRGREQDFGTYGAGILCGTDKGKTGRQNGGNKNRGEIA